MKEDNISKKRLKTGLNILLGTEKQIVSNKKELNDESDFLLNITDIKPNKQQPRIDNDTTAQTQTSKSHSRVTVQSEARSNAPSSLVARNAHTQHMQSLCATRTHTVTQVLWSRW